jgi:hypothetical protein
LRTKSIATAPKTAIGVQKRTLIGSVQLSYWAARIRNTKSRESAKIAAGGIPWAASFS